MPAPNGPDSIVSTRNATALGVHAPPYRVNDPPAGDSGSATEMGSWSQPAEIVKYSDHISFIAEIF